MPSEVLGARSAVRTTAANRRAAVRDSAQLLLGVVPPPGAVVLSKRSAIGIQRTVPVLTPAFASALASERWSVPGQPGAVLSYVEAHLPLGSKVFSTGSGGPAPAFQSVIRSWAPVGGVLDTRWLEIAVAGRPNGGTNLFAESQSQWVVARPAGERIPAGVTEVDVTEGLPGHPPQLSRTVTAPVSVDRLVTLFNSLGIVQPVAINCPAETVEQIVTVTFRGSGERSGSCGGDRRLDRRLRLSGQPARLVVRFDRFHGRWPHLRFAHRERDHPARPRAACSTGETPIATDRADPDRGGRDRNECALGGPSTPTPAATAQHRRADRVARGRGRPPRRCRRWRTDTRPSTGAASADRLRKLPPRAPWVGSQTMVDIQHRGRSGQPGAVRIQTRRSARRH